MHTTGVQIAFQPLPKLVLNTDGPHIKLAWLRPQSKIMRIDMSRFLPHQLPHTLEGTPCASIVSINMLSTVSDLLFGLA